MEKPPQHDRDAHALWVRAKLAARAGAPPMPLPLTMPRGTSLPVLAGNPLKCQHLGGPTGETKQCATCRGSVSIKLFSCAVHGTCSLGKPVPGVQTCDGCTDKVLVPAAPRATMDARHLLYHVYPRAKQPHVWRRGIDQLRMRWSLFTGRKVVAVVTGDGLSPAADVREYLPADAEVVEVANDSRLREVATWGPLWSQFLAGSPRGAVLYAHAKGVTRSDDPGNSCHWWSSMLYSLCLDRWDAVAAQLKHYPITGAFKKVGRGFRGSRSAWHYSGSFFWARLDDFAGRPWQQIDRQWWGSEAWPGLAYRATEAGCIFHEGRVPSLDLYAPKYWDHVRLQYAAWLSGQPGKAVVA